MLELGRVVLPALLERADTDERVRRALHELGAWLVARFSGSGSGLHEWTVPRGHASEGGSRSHRPERERRPVDLGLVRQRSEWKAEACRWAADEAGAGSDDARRRGQDLAERRKGLDDCFPWMLRRSYEAGLLRPVAEAYDNVAFAAGAVAELSDLGALEPAPPPALLYALAEVQSALLAALARADVRSDSDQRDLFLWLKDQTTVHRIYVDRHMRLDDPADYSDFEGIRRRVAGAIEEARASHARKRRRRELLKKVDYHAARVASAPDPREHEWASLADAVGQWIEEGLPLADPELRRRFGRNLRERVPPEVPAALQPLLSQEPAAGSPRRCRPETVDRVADLLGGLRVSLLSELDPGPLGDELRQRFGLAELRWVPVSPDRDAEPALDAAIAAHEVDLVLIAVRLPAAAYSSFRRRCQERQLPFVRLPRGFEPEEVAYHVQRQVARRLRSDEPAEPLRSESA